MKLAKTIADWLVINGAEEKNRRIYEYGAECFINELIADALLLLFGLLLNRTGDMLIWLVTFTAIRVNLGGIHANSHLTCIISSVTLGVLCVISTGILSQYPLFLVVMTLVCMVLVFRLAPVIHVNHPVSEQKKKEARKKALLFSLLEGIAVVGFLFCAQVQLAALIFSSILSSVLLAVAGRFSVHALKG